MGRRLGGLLALLLLAAAALAVTAPAADRTDPSFAQGGFVETPLSAEVAKWPGSPVIWDVAPAAGGRFVGALADMSSRQSFFTAVRYKRNGSLDRGFGEHGFTAELDLLRHKRPQAQAIAVQRDGRVVVGGYLQGIGNSSLLLARFRPDGSLDRGFGEAGIAAPDKKQRVARGRIHDIALGPGGRIFAAGALGEGGIGESGRNPAGVVVAFGSDGRIDRRFGDDGRVVFSAPGDGREYTGLKSIRALPGGELLVAGFHFGSLFLARLHSDGSLDSGFGGGDGKVTVFVGDRQLGCSDTCFSSTPLQIDSRGKILVAVSAFPDPPVLLRFWPDGSLDAGFGRGGRIPVRFAGHRLNVFGMALQAGRPLLVGSDERRRGSAVLSFAVARYRPDGRVDRGFGSRGIFVRHPGEFSGGYTTLSQGKRVIVAGGAADVRKGGVVSFLQLTRFLLGR